MQVIINTILYALYGFLSIVASPLLLLPDVSLPSQFTTALSSASTYISALNTYLPISDILTLLFLVIAYELAYATYKLIKWGYNKIPGIT